MSKYDHLIHEFEKQYNYWGDFMPPYQAYFRGHDCMPDSSFYASYRCYMKEAFVDRSPNFHSEGEYKRVTKPVYFQVLSKRGKFGPFFKRIDADGRTYVGHLGSKGHNLCALDDLKQCTFCGKCYTA